MVVAAVGVAGVVGAVVVAAEVVVGPSTSR